MRFLSIVVVIVCGVACVAQSASRSFDFNEPGASGSWLAADGRKDISDLRVKDGTLSGVATGSDPYLPIVSGLNLDASTLRYCVLRMSATAGHPETRLQLFFNVGTGTDPLYAEAVLVADGKFHDYIVDLAAIPGLRDAGRIANFRLDPIEPASAGDTFAVDHVRFYADKDDLSDIQKIYRKTGNGSRVAINVQRINDNQIQADGDLNEALWQERDGWHTGFVRSICERDDVATLDRGQTRFKIVEDDQNVYFAIVCDTADLQAMDRNVYAHNDLALFNREVVEVFIAAERDPHLVYQLGVNPAGSYAELMDGVPCLASANVNTRITDTGYQVEIALDKQRFGQLYKEANRQLFPAIWTVNVARTQTGVDAEDRYSSWIYTGNQFNNRRALGTVRFGASDDALAMMAGQYVNELTIRLSSASGTNTIEQADDRAMPLHQQVNAIISAIERTSDFVAQRNSISDAEFSDHRQLMMDNYATALTLLTQLQAIAFALDDSSDQDYYWFMPPLTERPAADRLPGRDELVDVVIIRLAGDEKAARRFSLYTKNELKNVAISWSDLVGDNGQSIAHDSVDVRILHRWSERGDADVLATDLRVPLDGWLEKYASAERFIPVIANNSTAHFLVKVRSAAGQAPGTYRGEVVLRAADGCTITVSVQAEVLPFDLLPTNRRVGFWYSGTLPGQKAHSYHAYSGQTSEESMLRELRTLREDGFNDVDLMNYVNGPFNPDYTQTILTIARTAGFEQVIISGAEHFIGSDGCTNALPATEDERQALQQAKEKLGLHLRDIATIADDIGIVVRVFGFDEPRDDNMFKASELIFEEAHKAGLKTSLAVLYHHEAHKIPNLDELLLVSQFNTDEKSLQWIERHRDEYDLVGYYPNYTADGIGELRLMYGWFLYKSNLDVSMAWAYYSIARDPFHIWPPGFHQAGYYAFPTRDDPLPTLKYEATREGVNDLRYLETLEHHLEAMSDRASAERLKRRLDALLGTFDAANNAGIQSKNYLLPGSTYERLRAEVQDLLLEVVNPL